MVPNPLTDSTAAKATYVLESSKPMTKWQQVNDVLTLQSFGALPGSTASDSQC